MSSTRPTIRERLSYLFDNLMSKGTLALVGGLFLISLTIMLLAAAVVHIGGLLTAPEGCAQPYAGNMLARLFAHQFWTVKASGPTPASVSILEHTRAIILPSVPAPSIFVHLWLSQDIFA